MFSGFSCIRHSSCISNEIITEDDQRVLKVRIINHFVFLQKMSSLMKKLNNFLSYKLILRSPKLALIFLDFALDQ